MIITRMMAVMVVAGMWVDKRGNFHFLMHYIPDNVLVARHAFARDYTGPWAMHETTIPYNSTVRFTDGGVGKCSTACESILAVRSWSGLRGAKFIDLQ
jgi:hypothetical protein